MLALKVDKNTLLNENYTQISDTKNALFWLSHERNDRHEMFYCDYKIYYSSDCAIWVFIIYTYYFRHNLLISSYLI